MLSVRRAHLEDGDVLTVVGQGLGKGEGGRKKVRGRGREGGRIGGLIWFEDRAAPI